MRVTPFTITRSLQIGASPDQINPLLIDLRAWQQWSPWEGLDPALVRVYEGPDSGVGARYEWRGNRKAGAGSMVITDAADQVVEIDLEFTRPFKATNKVEFTLNPDAAGTQVTWTLRGENTSVGALFSRLFRVEQQIGADLEKGLSQLKKVAEAT